jgi:hypothetical protein
LLLEIKAAVEQAREAGEKQLASEEQAGLSQRYDELVRQGLKLNPPLAARAAPTAMAPAAGKEEAGCQKQAHNLRRRLECSTSMTSEFMPWDSSSSRTTFLPCDAWANRALAESLLHDWKRQAVEVSSDAEREVLALRRQLREVVMERDFFEELSQVRRGKLQLH